jgi:hypothetical protein
MGRAGPAINRKVGPNTFYPRHSLANLTYIHSGKNSNDSLLRFNALVLPPLCLIKVMRTTVIHRDGSRIVCDELKTREPFCSRFGVEFIVNRFRIRFIRFPLRFFLCGPIGEDSRKLSALRANCDKIVARSAPPGG